MSITETLDRDFGTTNPTRALIDELANHLEVALDPRTAENQRVHARGLVAGYLIAFGLETPDTLAVAQRTYFAAPYLFEEAMERGLSWRTVRDQDGYLFACGVLLGFKEGTRDRPDAEECTACSRRICIDVADDTQEHTVCGHGTICASNNRDCWSTMHAGTGHRECDPNADDRADAALVA